MSLQPTHQNQPLLTHGAPLEDAECAAILLHGRGASAHDLLELVHQLPQTGIAYLLPQAANNTWYPNSGFAPLETNEPYLSSAMAMLEELITNVGVAGIPQERLIMGGFSQGACLSAEFVAQHAQRYGGLLVLSGALMGPLDQVRNYSGSLDGTPVYIGGVNQDQWVTEVQLRHTAQVLTELGADITIDVEDGSEHTIRPHEIIQSGAIIERVVNPT